MIKAVLFDLGNTLVYSHPEETFQEIMAKHGVVKSLEDVRAALTQGNEEFDAERHEGLSVHAFYTQWNIVQLKHLGLTGPKARQLAESIDTLWWKFAKFYVFRDVKRTLQQLRKMRLQLGIVTGGFEEDIEMIVPSTGLGEFFDVLVGANTTGKRKPHPGAFKHALMKLGVSAGETVFVGDNFNNDYLGAQKVGLIPVLIRRKSSSAQRLFTDSCLQLPSETRMIERLDQIFDVLRQLSP